MQRIKLRVIRTDKPNKFIKVKMKNIKTFMKHRNITNYVILIYHDGLISVAYPMIACPIVKTIHDAIDLTLNLDAEYIPETKTYEESQNNPTIMYNFDGKGLEIANIQWSKRSHD